MDPRRLALLKSECDNRRVGLNKMEWRVEWAQAAVVLVVAARNKFSSVYKISLSNDSPPSVQFVRASWLVRQWAELVVNIASSSRQDYFYPLVVIGLLGVVEDVNICIWGFRVNNGPKKRVWKFQQKENKL